MSLTPVLGLGGGKKGAVRSLEPAGLLVLPTWWAPGWLRETVSKSKVENHLWLQMEHTSITQYMYS